MEASYSTPIEREPAGSNDYRYARRWRASDAASIITILVILSGFLTAFLSPRRDLIGGPFTIEHVLLLRMTDNGPQRATYAVGILLLAILCTLAAVAIRRPEAHAPALTRALRTTTKFLKKWCGTFLIAATVVVLVFDVHSTALPGPDGTGFPGADSRTLRLIFWLASACFMVLLLFWIRERRTRGSGLAVWCCVCAYSSFLLIPGLIRVPFLSEPLLNWAEWHYSVTLAQGDRLAAGLRLGSQVNLNYGLIHTLVLAILERTVGILNFGQHIQLVQGSQIAFLAVAFLAFRLWRPANPMFALFGLVLIGPWLSTSHLAVYYPNLAGWRNLGLAAGVAVLLLCKQLQGRTAWLLGATAGLLVLYNPETGICLTFGYALFLLSRQENVTWNQLGGLAWRAVAGALTSFGLLLILYRAGLGVWPPFGATALFGFVTRFGQGYGGLPLYFDPLAVLITVHCVYLVSVLLLRWRVRDLTWKESFELGISATILLWISYYVNRPYPWNLWTHQFLYLFLIANLFQMGTLRRLAKRGILALCDSRVAALTFVLMPVLLSSNHFILIATVRPAGEPAISTRVSGISLPRGLAGSLEAKADFLSNQDPSDTLFFSRHSYSLSLLTQRFDALPVQDAFAETITHFDFERLVEEIDQRSPRVLLFDAPDNLSLSYMHFFKRMESRLAGRYYEDEITNGWQVWRLRSPARSSDISNGIRQP